MLRALKLHDLQDGRTVLPSDASPDVEGIETTSCSPYMSSNCMSDASPDVEGIETIGTEAERVTDVLSDASPDVEGIETFNLKRLSHECVMSDASPDVEGIETDPSRGHMDLCPVRCIARC